MKTGTKHSHRINAATAIAVALFLTLLLAGCGGPPGAGGDGGPAGTAAPDGGRGVDEDTAFAVNVTRPVRGEIKNYLELNGDVEPASSVDVYPDTNGEVANMRVRVGQTVSRNDVIAEVDRSRPGQQFEPSPVRAPVAGTITQRYVSVGSTVGPSVPVVQISDTNVLEIRTRVAERFISLVREGQESIIFLEAYPEASFPARVTELSPVVDPATRTMGVTLEFVRRDTRVKAGMFVEIRLVTAVRRDVVKVQSEAVVRRFDTPYVFVLSDDDTVEQREVSLGISIGNQVQITDGLEADEEVIIQGQSLLDDGAEVRVIEEVESLSPEHVISEREGS
ncbi:MAG: efflux RND transporter periplasmic adaptor subunit [Spirochaetes bacterium]|jgi:multidrug efflux pump subunit AcrA (membrane-fusion protein)|nr:efflux RND transporter periplasmic adaptor subunit [Spirochaetota bacterium]